MLKSLKKYYYYTPVFFQNILISIYGYFRHKERHGGSYKKYLEEYQSTLKFNEAQMLEYQKKLLIDEINNAFENVEFYKEYKFDINPKDSLINILNQLPIFSKSQLRNSKLRIFSNQIKKGDYYISKTSGTTGTPFAYYTFYQDLRRRMALLEILRNQYNAKEGDYCATFTGNTIVPNNQSKRPFWRYNFFGKQMLFSTYHMKEENMKYYVDKLNTFKPKILEGYPSALFILSSYINDKKIVLKFQPKLILSTAETLLDHQREIIESVFKTKVINYYGSSDGAPLIFECSEGKMHIVPESGIFEVLDEQNNPTPAGSTGELVATTLFSKAQPVIRFKTGDMVLLPKENIKCSCGNIHQYFERVEGRKDDFLYSTERGYVGRVSQLPKLLPKTVIECQFVQESIDLIILNIVTKNNIKLKEEELFDFYGDFKLRLGEKISLKLNYLESIPRGANNKFKFVISKIKSVA